MTTTKQQQEKAQLREHALPVGSTVLTGKSGRKYKILEVLGAGGFGITYKAVAEVKLENGMTASMFFAIKEHFMKGCYRDTDRTRVLCPPTLKGDVEQSREDFRMEAERLMKLNGQSPNIVKVNEWFDANGTRYYAMEYLDGQTLEQYAGGRPLPEAEALSLLLPVARAVELVHKERLLHLDIKPDNIVLKTDFVSGATIPVLIDFGLAKHFDGKGRPTSHLVAKGATEGYAPMEQYAEIDHFAPEIDVYALGSTLFFLLTGQNPPKAFDIPSVSVLIGKLPASVGSRVRKALEGAMQPSKYDRTQTVAEFEVALEEGISDGGEEAFGSKMVENNTILFKQKNRKTRLKKKLVIISIICIYIFGLYVIRLCQIRTSIEYLAEHGDLNAQIELAERYFYRRNGINEDKQIAVYWYRKVADQGNASAQNCLGDCYYNGWGVPLYYTQAFYWYREAAAQGYVEAQTNLGDCYFYGKGVSQDSEIAVYWYRKAAEQENARAQFNLGICYTYGSGVSQDSEIAKIWLKKAEENGYAPYKIDKEETKSNSTRIIE